MPATLFVTNGDRVRLMHNNIGLPGDPGSDDPQTIQCPGCGGLATRQLSGLYECMRNRMHIIRKLQEGLYALVDDDASAQSLPVSRDSKESRDKKKKKRKKDNSA